MKIGKGYNLVLIFTLVWLCFWMEDGYALRVPVGLDKAKERLVEAKARVLFRKKVAAERISGGEYKIEYVLKEAEKEAIKIFKFYGDFVVRSRKWGNRLLPFMPVSTEIIVRPIINPSNLTNTPVLFEDDYVFRARESFLQAIKMLKKNGNIPIVILTEHSEEDIRRAYWHIDTGWAYVFFGTKRELKGIKFYTASQLGLQDFNFWGVRSPIVGINMNYMQMTPLTEYIGEEYPLLGNARNKILSELSRREKFRAGIIDLKQRLSIQRLYEQAISL